MKRKTATQRAKEFANKAVIKKKFSGVNCQVIFSRLALHSIL